MFKYTFIIPHKNSPELLQRCLDSIPEREDVQIIIVDDNSDSRKVNFGSFPGMSRENTEIIFDKTNKGAGHARNLGLKNAIGEWVLFIDADDYYKDGFLEVLDKCANKDLDVVYFDFERVVSETLIPCRKEVDYSLEINKFIESGNDSFFRFGFNAPWNKMVKKRLIDEHHVSFEEIMQGNDTFYSLQIGYYAKNIIIIPDSLYFYTFTPNSITHRQWGNKEYLLCLENLGKKNRFLSYIGHDELRESFIRLLLHFLRRKGVMTFCKVIFLFIINYGRLKEVEKKYINLI